MTTGPLVRIPAAIHISCCMVTLTVHARPRKRWLDNVKQDCATLLVTLPNADRLAKDRSGWRSLIHQHVELELSECTDQPSSLPRH